MSLLGIQQPSEKSAKWLRLFRTCGPLLPSLISLLYPPWTIRQFTPRQIIYENDLLPFFLALWAAPTSPTGHLSRLVQAVLLYLLPISTFECHQLWIFTAILRTGLGHILTRCVGWAHPRFFSHWSLYETSGGYGPSIIAYIFLMGGTDFIKTVYKRTYKVGEMAVLVAISVLLCWLDNAPWTYGVAIIGTSAVAACLTIIRTKTSFHPMLPDAQKQSSPPKIRTLVGCLLISLFVLSLPYGFQNWISTSPLTGMPPSPSASAPLLEILILSHPRPDITAATKILSTTISSYLPFLNSDVALSVFTHSTSHAAFSNARQAFKRTNVTFYIDADSHPDAVSGQYLHAGEAFRWVLERSSKAEWVMLVEDDFPICGGENGWDAVRRVMRILEDSRSEDTKELNKQGGFIGTGGSGLIIHRTVIPVLALLMHTHAEIASKLPPHAARRPADLVIQDCLLGTDPLCPTVAGGGGLVITSRMVMDHIGGMVTTNKNKALNDDKWRCGWRHPFHGRPQVEVIVV